MSCLAWLLLSFAVGGESVEEIILREITQGEYAQALRRIDAAVVVLRAEGERRERLEALRARCFYEMGDYAACESVLRGILARGPSSQELKRDTETKLARVL